MRSFQSRVVAALAVVTLLTLGTYVAFVFLLFRQQLKSDLDNQLTTYGRSVTSALRAGHALPDPPLGANQLGAVVIDVDGDVTSATKAFEPELERAEDGNGGDANGAEGGDSGDGSGGSGESEGSEGSHDEIGPLTTLTAAATPQGTYVNVPGREGTDLRAWARTVLLGGDRYTVAALAPASASGSPASRLVAVSGIGIAIAVALVGAVAWMSGGLAVRPLGNLTSDVHALNEQDLGQRVDVPPAPTEVAEVARAINTLLGRIEGSLSRERQFIADASHELRSPLAVLRGELELAARSKDPVTMRAGLESAIDETDRLARLADDLLLLARTEAGFAPAAQAVSLADMTGSALIQAGASAKSRDVRLSLEGEDALVVAQQALAERAIANLVENAIDYAPAGSTVDVAMWTDGDRAGVDVVDRGPGIPEAERDHVFDRFARVDESRARSLGGFGLGLAIVRSIMDAVGGSAELIASEPGRTRFRLSFRSSPSAAGDAKRP